MLVIERVLPFYPVNDPSKQVITANRAEFQPAGRQRVRVVGHPQLLEPINGMWRVADDLAVRRTQDSRAVLQVAVS